MDLPCVSLLCVFDSVTSWILGGMLEGMFAACCCDGTLADDAHVMGIEGAHVAM